MTHQELLDQAYAIADGTTMALGTREHVKALVAELRHAKQEPGWKSDLALHRESNAADFEALRRSVDDLRTFVLESLAAPDETAAEAAAEKADQAISDGKESGIDDLPPEEPDFQEETVTTQSDTTTEAELNKVTTLPKD